MKKYLVIFFFLILTIFLFKDFVFNGLLPIPADDVVGGYYPWRDEVWMGKIAGYPVKNFKILDIVRQLYPWRLFTMESFKLGELPLWNPYNFTGTPHLANVFTSSFYPFNFLFFIAPFSLGWSFYILIQPFLVALATFVFLKNLKINYLAALLGSLVFAFSSFLMIRLEFGMVGHTALWLPLSLLAVDKFFNNSKKIRWWLLSIICLSLSFLAGYLQVTIYTYFIFTAYAFFRFLQKKDYSVFFLLISAPFLAFFLIGFQSIPLLELVKSSSRIGNYGLQDFFANQFFLPWSRLITFLIPDFFGNDVTGNFWGQTSYYEFSGYVGVITIFFVIFSLFYFRHRKEICFWFLLLVLSFLFAFPTFLSKFFYSLNIPGLSVLIPARIIFVINFSLAVLSAFGLNYFIKEKEERKLQKRALISASLLLYSFVAIGIVFLFGFIFLERWHDYALVSIRNSVLPLASLIILCFSLCFYFSFKRKGLRFSILIFLIFILAFNLVRHGYKYNTFTPKEILFPTTKVLDFLNDQDNKLYRLQITHQELMTANLNIPYKIQMIDGYDSFHTQRFEELVMAGNFENPQKRFQSPGRSIFLANYRSPIFDLMNVGYVLSLEEIKDPKLKKVFQEGKTIVYQNNKSYPRAYLTNDFEVIKEDEKILERMIDFSQKEERKVILEEEIDFESSGDLKNASLLIEDYQSQRVKIISSSLQKSILVLTDAYDPGWQALIDGQSTKIYRANYNFRAVLVPEGKHEIVFQYKPLSFKIGLYLSIGTFLSLLVTSLVFESKKQW